MRTQQERLLEHAACFGYHVERDEKSLERQERQGYEAYYVEKSVTNKNNESSTQGVKVFFIDGKFDCAAYSNNQEVHGVSGPRNYTTTKSFFEGPKLYGKVEWTEGSAPAIGVAATLHFYSDAQAYTVVDVINEKKIVVRACTATLKDGWRPEIQPGGFAGHCTNNRDQEYTYEDREELGGRVFTLRKNGNWCEEGQESNSSKLRLGYRKAFHDYNF